MNKFSNVDVALLESLTVRLLLLLSRRMGEEGGGLYFRKGSMG